MHEGQRSQTVQEHVRFFKDVNLSGSVVGFSQPNIQNFRINKPATLKGLYLSRETQKKNLKLLYTLASRKLNYTCTVKMRWKGGKYEPKTQSYWTAGSREDQRDKTERKMERNIKRRVSEGGYGEGSGIKESQTHKWMKCRREEEEEEQEQRGSQWWKCVRQWRTASHNHTIISSVLCCVLQHATLLLLQSWRVPTRRISSSSRSVLFWGENPAESLHPSHLIQLKVKLFPCWRHTELKQILTRQTCQNVVRNVKKSPTCCL